MDSYFDDILKDTEHHACTHTHTCNPPVHDLSHTHTCVHVHTKIVTASPDAAKTAESPSENNDASKKRPSGNRAAVRKYREKKKAHTASLEEEVVHLRALNQQLMKKLQNHAARLRPRWLGFAACLWISEAGLKGRLAPSRIRGLSRISIWCLALTRDAFLVLPRLPTPVISDATIRCIAILECRVL
jgi:hypothetical protein